MVSISLCRRLAAGALLALLSWLSPALAHAAGHERLSLDRGWLFHLGDVSMQPAAGHGDSYNMVKAGNAQGAAGTAFDDSDWRHLDLPHDWAVEGPFDARENIAQGYRPRGIAWYRRYLRIDPAERGRHFELQFDGIATHAQIWVNGNLVRHSWSGYSASIIDITPFVRYGEALNTVAVRVDADALEGWWYEGAGIYRHSWLVKRDAFHIETDGLHATPRLLQGDRWQLPLDVSLANSGTQPASAQLEVSVYDPQGRRVARRSQAVTLGPLGTGLVKLPVDITAPQRWTLAAPQLYRVEAALRQGDRVLDSLSLHTGFRTLRFDADRGFFLNGQATKLQGVCIHQDHAGVGVAVPDAIWAYRLRRLKELGVNAIRFSHNATAPEVLDLADRMGFLVMAENRQFNPAPETLAQLEWMVRRDRHHPAVVLWSIFNEEPVQGSEVGYEMARRMAAAVKRLDDTRPVTAAMNGGFFSALNVSHAVDVVGFNYEIKQYDRFHAARPGVPITSSEDTSAFMTRGEFSTVTTPADGPQFSASYDDDFAPWGNSHRDAWQAIATRPFVAGGFVWTGFDYRGEPTPHKWPATGSSFGIMDLNGFAKTAYYLHQVQWIRDRPLVHIAPHWNWPGREGQPVRVMLMANTQRVRLSLNGRLVGEQAVDPLRMNFLEVPYEAGRLEAEGLTDGRVVASAVVETTGPAVALQLLPDRAELLGDGRDALPVTVQAVDAQGRVVPLDASLVRLAVAGAGRSLGHGNGDPNSHEDEKGPTRRLFHGLAQLIVQSSPLAGEVTVQATADGLAPVTLRLPVRAAPAVAEVAPEAAPPTYLQDWRIAPHSLTRPDPLQVLADNDMNTWGWGSPPLVEVPPAALPAPAGATVWRLYRSQVTPRKNLADGSASLRFAGIQGRAEVWVDGVLLARKIDFEPGTLEMRLPAGSGERRVTVLVESEPGQPAGLAGLVRLE
jgi:beta-galactosidase